MAVTDGQLTAFRNRVNNVKFDRRGGWADNFAVDLQRVGGGGAGWNGASWRMERLAANAASNEPDFETFLTDVVQDAQTNTGTAAVQFIYQIHEDDYPGQHPSAGFDGLLANTTIKPWALEVVPFVGGPS